MAHERTRCTCYCYMVLLGDLLAENAYFSIAPYPTSSFCGGLRLVCSRFEFFFSTLDLEHCSLSPYHERGHACFSKIAQIWILISWNRPGKPRYLIKVAYPTSVILIRDLHQKSYNLFTLKSLISFKDNAERSFTRKLVRFSQLQWGPKSMVPYISKIFVIDKRMLRTVKWSLPVRTPVTTKELSCFYFSKEFKDDFKFLLFWTFKLLSLWIFYLQFLLMTITMPFNVNRHRKCAVHQRTPMQS